VFAEQMAALGIGDDSLVVAYDDGTGAWAGRLVWMLRTLGVDAALLDGGLAAWEGPLETGAPAREQATFTARPWDPASLATIDDAATAPLVVDARAPERYRGESEPVDPRAGHVPGAVNVPFSGNLADGRFLSPDALRERFAEHGITDATGVVVYCGSGVTACHDLIALEHAGLGRGRLYSGSWSQYAATDRPAATGAEPGSKAPIDTTGRLSV
jgi:thiosulfate/3-mercaptopyruvate sulfurtransferase